MSDVVDEWAALPDDDSADPADPDPPPFDYDNPPYIPLASLNMTLLRYNGNMKTGGLVLTFNVDAADKPLALPITDYPGQELRVAIERVDYPDLVEQEPLDADGEWDTVNYSEDGWRGERKRDGFTGVGKMRESDE